MSRRIAQGTFVALGSALAACCLTRKPSDPLNSLTQERAGSTRISVLAVKRLADFREDLQPNFTMTNGDQALGYVLPVTSSVQDVFRDALAASLKLGLPTMSTTVADELTKKTGDPDSSKTTTTTNTSLPDLSGSAASAPTWTTLTAPSGQFSKDLTGMDPMLRFLVATALFQEVKLLNTYIRDAAIDCNYEAFVVRLQIALAPVRRGLPLVG